MTSRTFTRLAGASLIVTTSMVGCSGAQMEHRPALASNQATDIAASIERSLAGRDFAKALLDAERLVDAQPRDAKNRALLGRAYLANGRYASARTAFEDAMTLGAADPRTIISLSMVRTALGNADSARALLIANIEHLPASDYGLAMAMAGDAREGVRALLEATRMPDADVKTRQNLAYALALGGEWGQARLVAGQDLSGNQLQARLAQWAASAQAGASEQRVAALIGVSPRADDSGLPARLALYNSEQTSLAAIQPLEAVDMAKQAAETAPAPIETAQVEPALAEPAKVEAAPSAAAPVAVALAEAPAPAPVTAEAAFPVAPAAPLIRASADPMRAAVMQRLTESAIATQDSAAHAFAKPRGLAAIPASTAPKGSVHGGSDWVVQIGAYNTVKFASAAWSRAQGNALEQRGYRKVTGTITLDGRTYHRLAMSGFSDRNAAYALCSTLRAQGQNCFVRRDEAVASEIRMARAGKAPALKTAAVVKAKVKMATDAKPQKVAAR